MLAPEIPKDEQKRIKKLYALNILDTAAEERFDRLSRLAKRIFNADIAIISFVDSDRQWFKSTSQPHALPPETSRDTSFCAHAILGSEAMVVEDASLDERFKDNPFVINDPKIRFYAGYPLHMSDGSALGTLCILASEPRKFSADDVQILNDLGAMAEQEIATIQNSTLDDLTKISNQKGFFEYAGQSYIVSKRKGVQCSLLLLSLNNFERIAEKFGKAESKRVLVNFTDLLREVFRDSDIFGRIDENEFAVFMVDSDDANAKTAIMRLHNALERYIEQDGLAYSMQFSAGHIVGLPGTNLTLDDLLALARERMKTDRFSDRHWYEEL